MWQPAPLFGALAGDLFRYSVASALILIVGLILGFRPQGGALGVLLAVALVMIFCFALSWLLDHHRHAGPHARVGHDDELPLPHAAHVREQHLRGPVDHAAAGSRRSSAGTR